MLTFEQFSKIPAGSVFDSGQAEDFEGQLYMDGTGRMLGWVAVKGWVNDWCIYTHFAEYGNDYIESNGDKVMSEDNIRFCVPCDNETIHQYRY
jgi:hypothetical protein